MLYGPEERAVSLNGKADLTLGGHPRLDGTVSARQLDVDRALAAPDVTRRPPFLVLKSFVEAFVATAKPPLPLAIGVNLDAVTVGGTSIQSVHGDIRFDDKGWSLKDLDFRAPGLTQVKLTGRLDDTAQGLAFSGPASIESTDLKMLMAWLEGRGDQPSGPSETLTAHGDVTVARGRLAIDHLTATADQENIAGRLAYTWAVDDRHPAVLDGELHAQQLDIDALVAFAKAATTGSAFEAPREVALVLDVGKATFAGVEARTVNAQVKFDAGVLRIDRLSVGDVGGAALDVSGRIDELSSQPRGRVTFAVDARSLAGLTSLLGRFAPQAGEQFRRVADRLAPAKLHGVLVVDRAATAGTVAKLTLDGGVGATRVALNGEAKGELAQPGAAVVRIDSRFDADDGGALARLLGLDRVVAVDQLPGQMTISAAGPLNGELRVNGCRRRRRLFRHRRRRDPSERRRGAGRPAAGQSVGGRFAAASPGHDRAGRGGGCSGLGERGACRRRRDPVVHRSRRHLRQDHGPRPSCSQAGEPVRHRRRDQGRRDRRRGGVGGAGRGAKRRASGERAVVA